MITLERFKYLLDISQDDTEADELLESILNASMNFLANEFGLLLSNQDIVEYTMVEQEGLYNCMFMPINNIISVDKVYSTVSELQVEDKGIYDDTKENIVYGNYRHLAGLNRILIGTDDITNTNNYTIVEPEVTKIKINEGLSFTGNIQLEYKYYNYDECLNCATIYDKKLGIIYLNIGGNYGIVYNAGFNENNIPDDIEYCVYQIGIIMYSMTKQAKNGVERVQITGEGSYKISYSLLPEYLKTILRKYTRVF